MEMNKMNKNITEEEIEELRIKYTKRELAYMFLQLRNLYYQNKMETFTDYVTLIADTNNIIEILEHYAGLLESQGESA